MYAHFYSRTVVYSVEVHLSTLVISFSYTAVGSKLFGPKQYPFLALLPAEVWADIVVEEASGIVHFFVVCPMQDLWNDL